MIQTSESYENQRLRLNVSVLRSTRLERQKKEDRSKRINKWRIGSVLDSR